MSRTSYYLISNIIPKCGAFHRFRDITGCKCNGAYVEIVWSIEMCSGINTHSTVQWVCLLDNRVQIFILAMSQMLMKTVMGSAT